MIIWVMKIFFVQFFCVSCHLFLISSASVIPYYFCPFLSPSLHEIFPGISNFLQEISSLSHSVVFLYFFALIAEEGFFYLLLIPFKRFMRLDLIEFLMNYGQRFVALQGSRPSPWKRNAKWQNGCLRRPYK